MLIGGMIYVDNELSTNKMNVKDKLIAKNSIGSLNIKSNQISTKTLYCNSLKSK